MTWTYLLCRKIAARQPEGSENDLQKRTLAKLYLLGLPLLVWGLGPLLLWEGFAGAVTFALVCIAYMVGLHLFACPVCKASMFTRGSNFFGVGWPFKKCWKCGHVLDG